MTEIIVAQDAPVLVAIDIAKARHEVLIAIPDKKRRRRLTVLNELADFNRLIDTLRDYGCPVRVAFEATGNYHRALGYHLATADLSNWVFGSSSFSFFLLGLCHSSGSRFSSQSG
tara:strand:+ start:214 stop:558 length:345 start_codon:yes stop_codon:yes gene_type:complete